MNPGPSAQFAGRGHGVGKLVPAEIIGILGKPGQEPKTIAFCEYLHYIHNGFHAGDPSGRRPEVC